MGNSSNNLPKEAVSNVHFMDFGTVSRTPKTPSENQSFLLHKMVADKTIQTLRTPEIETTGVEYHPGNEEQDLNNTIEQILRIKAFSSKEEEILGKKSDRDTAEALLGGNLEHIMNHYATYDAENGIFGVGNEKSPGFSVLFKDSLLVAFAKISNDNDTAARALGPAFARIQSEFLTKYGQKVNNKELDTATIEIQTEGIRNSIGKWDIALLAAINDGKIPQEYKERLSMLLKAYVYNYIVPFWEMEKKVRKWGREEVKSA